MSTIEKPSRNDEQKRPADADRDRLEREIHRRQKLIMETDRTYIKTPEEWPDPPKADNLPI